ncbi:MAG: hypothetical protein R2991_12085 [Thermoanaerobaculia bacterium]
MSAAIRNGCEGAIRAIEEHRPFVEIVHRMGAVAYYVALANDLRWSETTTSGAALRR